MYSASLDPVAIYHRALEFAAQNLRLEKLWLQLGLDPAHVDFDAVFNRLIDIGLSNINIANMLALAGAIFYVSALMVRTIVPLRIIGIISILFFIAYGALAGSVATFFMYLLSLPVNIWQLRKMRPVDGLAAAVHDAAKISQGSGAFSQRRRRQRIVHDGERKIPRR